MAGPNFWGYTTQPAQTFGSRLGGDFANILQSLATDKAHQVKTNQNKRFLQSLGLRPDIAASLAPHSDENIFKFLSNFEGFDIGNPQQQTNPQQLLNQQTPAQVAPNNMQNKPNKSENRGQNQPNNTQNDVNGMIKQLYTDYPELRNQIGPEQLGQLLQNQAEQQALHPQGNTQPLSTGIKSKESAEAERKVRADQLKELHEERKLDREQTAKEVAEQKKWYAEELKTQKSLKQNIGRLDAMEKLNNSGKLSSSTAASIRDTLKEGFGAQAGNLPYLKIPGIDLTSWLLSPESQTFEKLSTDLIKGIRDIYGSRINQLEVETFLKTIPTLQQSKEGREVVINAIRRFTQDDLASVDLAKKIVKDNGGKVPADLQIRVYDELSDRLDETSNIIKDIATSYTPESKNKATGTLKKILSYAPGWQ